MADYSNLFELNKQYTLAEIEDLVGGTDDLVITYCLYDLPPHITIGLGDDGDPAWKFVTSELGRAEEDLMDFRLVWQDLEALQ